jgi:hypothetical protein
VLADSLPEIQGPDGDVNWVGGTSRLAPQSTRRQVRLARREGEARMPIMRSEERTGAEGAEVTRLVGNAYQAVGWIVGQQQTSVWKQ